MNAIHLYIRLAAFALLCFVLAPAAQAAPTFPKLTGRVVDDENILSDSVKQDLTQKLADLESKTSRQLVVVTVPSLQGYEIEDYGYQLGRAWGIGQKSSNNGVLFIIAPNERKVRIEVGYGLEPILTDALSEVILQSKVLPRFREGDMQQGVIDGTEALIQQLSLDEAAAKPMSRRPRNSRICMSCMSIRCSCSSRSFSSSGFSVICFAVWEVVVAFHAAQQRTFVLGRRWIWRRQFRWRRV